MNKLALSFAIVASLTTVAAAENRAGTPAVGSPMATVTAEVQKTLGFVPDFVKQLPQALVANWWHGVTTFQMNPTTKLDGKTKELIGLAVAAAAPCEYCIYFHTEAARLNGASEEEIKEAVGMAGLTRAGATILNGLQVDKVQFKKDVQRIVSGARAAKK
ncbi:MAG: carboxymuconolactone decarboxylase family protein [Deltaproteobacteria bacterium]|nr:carboxymuconolactone decarboxylase family protein [Deltaproteobacteria bacterium]